MDLRFDCNELSLRNDELLQAQRAMRGLADELSGMYAALDGHLKSYETVGRALLAAADALDGLEGRLAGAYRALGEVIDIYRGAQDGTRRIAEGIPGAAAAGGAGAAAAAALGGRDPSAGGAGGWEAFFDTGGAAVAWPDAPLARSASVAPVSGKGVLVEGWLRDLMGG